MREGSDRVIAVLCADIHLSPDPPRARRDELKSDSGGWYKAMKKSLDELLRVSSYYNVPILCAGDIFHHWRAEPALINFALQYLPEMYAIPGQHDLPLHNIDMIEKSAFWTLCLSDKIIPVINEEPVMTKNGVIVYGFPWGRKLKPLKKRIEGKFHVAIVHDFFWSKNHTHPKAPKSNHMSKFRDLVTGYDAVVFGDNHKGFKAKLNGVPVWNCGTMMRRNQDEKDYIPRIGLLCNSGKILTHGISTKNEKFKTVEEDYEGVCRMSTDDMADTLHGLKEAAQHNLDYAEALRFLMERYSVKNEVRKIIMEALDRV